MNLDELQSVQARERQSSDLQHLRASFYGEVGAFIESLSAERDRLVEEAEDPFSAPDVRQLTDDIETAEQTVEAIYERRVGKVVKKASIAAAGMPVDDDGLTEEEETLFEDLVARIEGNRETVLAVLDGETPDLSGTADFSKSIGEGTDTPDTSATSTPDPVSDQADPASDTGATSETEGVSAADLMGGGSDAEDDPGDAPDDDSAAEVPDDPLAADPDDGPTEVPPESGPPGGRDAADDGGNGPSDDDATGGTDDGEDGRSDGDRDVPGIPRTTVRITADVGEVVGADDRDYDLGPEDVVTLPEPNADVLVEKDAAERLE